MKKRLLEWLFINVFRARWIVAEEENAEGELGLRILGVNKMARPNVGRL